MGLPMTDVELSIPFQAYKGREPHIFVSYAHEDSRRVFSELQTLHQKEFRIWYDEGINPGKPWPGEIAEAIGRASFFLVFISEQAVKSPNVRNEISFALSEGKPLLAIHLEDTKLTPELRLEIGRLQAIMNRTYAAILSRSRAGNGVWGFLRMRWRLN
jgi:TIR domain